MKKYFIITPTEMIFEALRKHQGFYKSRQSAHRDAKRICEDSVYYVMQVPTLSRLKVKANKT